MGMYATAILCYGYEMGEDYDWYGPESEDGEGFEEDAMRVLRKSVGFTETDWQADGFFSRQAKADRRTGVEIVTHCSYDYDMHILAAAEYRAYQGSPAEIDSLDVKPEWRQNLKTAAKALGVEADGEPSWFLCSMYG